MVLTAMFLAVAIALGLMESLLPPLPSPVPMRYGLANIAVMYALLFLSAPAAFVIALAKSTFALISRGLIAGLTSLSGGLVSVLVMLILSQLTSGRISLSLLSVSGALSHNLAQYLFVIALGYMWLPLLALLPVLLVSGVVTGLLSAALLKAAEPALRRLQLLKGDFW